MRVPPEPPLSRQGRFGNATPSASTTRLFDVSLMSAFDPLRTLAVVNSKLHMRWVTRLLALGLVAAAAIYLLAVRERTLRSYAGVDVGMQLGTALNRLQNDGYVIVHGPPKVKDRDCTGDDKHTLVYGRDPTYSLTIAPDKNCRVREIVRSLRRGTEL